jgi:hypothetical protein
VIFKGFDYYSYHNQSVILEQRFAETQQLIDKSHGIISEMTNTNKLLMLINSLATDNQNKGLELAMNDEIIRILMKNHNSDYFQMGRIKGLYTIKRDCLISVFEKRITHDLRFKYETDTSFREAMERKFLKDKYDEYSNVFLHYDSSELLRILKEYDQKKY